MAAGSAGEPGGDIADPGLAAAGAARIQYAERAMPLLRALMRRFAADRPFGGLGIAACLHITAETAMLARLLAAGGARVRLAASNPLSTQDDIAAALAVSYGIAVFARPAWTGRGTTGTSSRPLVSGATARPTGSRPLAPQDRTW